MHKMPTKWNVAPIYFNNIFPFFGSIVVVGIMIRTRIVHLFAARGFLFMWRRRWQTLEKKKEKPLNATWPQGLGKLLPSTGKQKLKPSACVCALS